MNGLLEVCNSVVALIVMVGSLVFCVIVLLLARYACRFVYLNAWGEGVCACSKALKAGMTSEMHYAVSDLLKVGPHDKTAPVRRASAGFCFWRKFSLLGLLAAGLWLALVVFRDGSGDLARAKLDGVEPMAGANEAVQEQASIRFAVELAAAVAAPGIRHDARMHGARPQNALVRDQVAGGHGIGDDQVAGCGVRRDLHRGMFQALYFLLQLNHVFQDAAQLVPVDGAVVFGGRNQLADKLGQVLHVCSSSPAPTPGAGA